MNINLALPSLEDRSIFWYISHKMFERLGVTRVLLSVPSSAVTYTHSSCGDSVVLTAGFTIKSEEGSLVEETE